MSLTEVLPVEPVIPTTRQPSSRRQPRASAAARASGSAAANTQPLGSSRRRARRARRRSTTTPQAPARERRGGVLAAVGALAAEAEEEVARRRPRASRSRPARAARPRPRGTISAPPSAAIRSGRELDHAAGARGRERRSSSRATSRSSKGIFRPRSNSWPCSWPLPAITTVSPRARPRRARSAIAARRSGSTSICAAPPAPMPGADLVDDRLRVLGARVVGGDDGDVGEPVGDLAHQRALVAVAVAAAAEDADQPSPGGRDLARGSEHVLERVGRVGVVDEDRERLALVDRLEAARDALGVRQRARPRRSSSMPERARRRRARRARSRR